MATVSYRLEDLKKAIVGIGYVGENDHMHVLIDCKEVFDEYPDAVPTMAIVPPEGSSYPKTVTRNGNVVEWLVKDSDVTVRGDGEFQLTFTEGEVIKKSVIGRFRVNRAIGESGEAPSGVQDWLTDANEKLAEVEEATRDAEAAANHQPYIGIDGYWYTWNGEEFVKNVKAQGEKGDPGDPGSPGDPTTLIDDTAGEGQTGKTWSADKLDETTSQLLNAIQGLDNDKYEKPSGGIPATDMTQAVQDALTDAESAYQKPSGGIPASDIADGVIPTVPTVATQEQIKGGTDDLHPIAPIYQHESVFYALAKLAGADMASLSPVTVGQFPDTQKTAIQKMLGIYESPWELIREDTVTNATEADVEITVDGNGSAFELTDVYLQVWTPQQETAASIGDYGRVQSYYGDNNSIVSQMGTWTQSANTSAKYGQVLLTNENGAIRNEATQNATQYMLVNLTGRTNLIADDALLKIGTYSFKKITIKKVTGTMKYKLYGRRKWN